MITAQIESIASIVEEAKPLVAEHYREIAHFEDIPLDVDWDYYISSTHLRCFTVRDGGRLVGYAVYALGRNRHYRSSVQAVQDVLFVHPAHRGMAGFRLIRLIRAELKAQNVQVVYDHVKRKHPVLGRILERLGSEEIETIWATRLDKE